VTTWHYNVFRRVVCAIGLIVVATYQQPGAPAHAVTPAAKTEIADTKPSDFASAGLQPAEVRSFLTTLQQAVRDDDRQTVASLVAYPITIRIDGAPMTLADPAAFVAHYDLVLPERVQAAVEAAEPATLFANWQGIMIGRGKLWFAGVYEDDAETYDIRIIAINPD